MNLKKWTKYIKQYFNFSHEGFYEFPYLSNSPQLFVESAINTPTSRHVASEQAVYRDNPFTKGVMRYREIEEGFWITASAIEFKKNALIKAVYDKEVVSDYYSLTFTVFESQIQLQNTFADKVPFSSKYWGFKRPGTEVGAYFYKDSICEFYIYAFSKEWAEKNLSFKTLSEENQIKKFLNSDSGFITYHDIVPNAHELSKGVWKSLEDANKGHFNTIDLKMQTLNLVSSFFKNVFDDKRIDNYVPLDTPDYRKIAKAERIITDNVYSSFPGIEYIAKEVNMSETKLKTTFKAVYGVSMLQYFIEKKMDVAMGMIKNSNIQIKNISASIGYENASKFSATFKKQFGMLPSEVRDN
jgi:AraC-like DNA-binding protein